MTARKTTPPINVAFALIEYFDKKAEGEEVSVNSIAMDHGVPTSTLWRWIKKVENGELSIDEIRSLVNTSSENKSMEDDVDENDSEDVGEDDLIEMYIDKVSKDVGTPMPHTSLKTVALPKSVYAKLDEDSMLALTSLAFTRGYNDVNEFVKREVIPWMRVIEKLELKYYVKLDPDKFVEGFSKLVDENAFLKSKIESIKRILTEV